MAILFPPAAPALRGIAEGLAPLVPLGGKLSASAVAELHGQILGAAADARAQEAMAGAEDLIGRRLFAIAGAIEKHVGQPAVLDPDDVALLLAALRGCAEALERLPEPFDSRADEWEPA